jgi:putative hydrolase of the HAD superfamily
MNLKAVLFDLYGTLAYVKNPISSEEISEFLLARGYEVYPQSLDAASHYVSMIDYPKQGYDSWKAYLKQVLCRLDVETDTKTLEELATIYQKHRSLTLFQDAASAVTKAKELNLKTAIVTTIAHFCFHAAIKPIHRFFDVITTGYEVGCEKSNPKMHEQTLKRLGVIPQEAVMIGDELLVDMKIPKNLGMHTILLDRTNRIHRRPREADAKTDTLTEAVVIVEGWMEQ